MMLSLYQQLVPEVHMCLRREWEDQVTHNLLTTIFLCALDAICCFPYSPLSMLLVLRLAS
jgi:hypothetical protein